MSRTKNLKADKKTTNENSTDNDDKKGKKKKIILFCDPHQAEAIELSESNGITKCVADIGIVFFI